VQRAGDQLVSELKEIGAIMTEEWMESAGPEGRAIVEAVVAAYDQRCLVTSLPVLDDLDTMVRDVTDGICGFGPLQRYLDDPDVEEIWIAAGTYRPDRGTGDQDLSFEMRSDLQILGGFAGVETRRNDRDSWAHETVLSGEIGDPADVDDNTRVVIRAEAVAPSGVLSGVVVERGMAAALGLNSFGGGILVLSGGPTFSDVWVRECQAQPLAFGSAIFSHFSDATFRRVRVTGNGWARDGRGTVVLNGGSPTLANVQITGNRNLEDAALTLLEPEGTTIVNVTVWGNMTGGATAGVLRLLGGDLEVANSIVWGNVPENPDPDQPLAENNAVGIGAASRYTTVLGWAAFGEGNNGLNPQFVDPIGPDSVVGTPDDDLRLSPGSPVIDAGDNTALPPAAGSRDVAGVARFLDDPGTEDSGVGPGPIVDRGAHEFDGVTVSCPADVDGDGTVGFDDVLEVLSAWGVCGGCPADVDGSGDVGFDDLLSVLAAWGPCAG